MQPIQWVVVGVIALVFVGAMGWNVSRRFGRRAEAGPAVLREATAFESARVGAEAPADAVAFDAFAYRVPARLAGREVRYALHMTTEADTTALAAALR